MAVAEFCEDLRIYKMELGRLDSLAERSDTLRRFGHASDRKGIPMARKSSQVAAEVDSYRPQDVGTKGHYFPYFYPPTDGFGSRLKQARKASGLTVSQSAKLTNLDARQWKAWESAAHCAEGIDAPSVVAAASLLGVTLDWLAFGDEGLAKMRREMTKRKKALSLV